jgi:hypothetical protein
MSATLGGIQYTKSQVRTPSSYALLLHAIRSAFPDTEEVTGSIPGPPTKFDQVSGMSWRREIIGRQGPLAIFHTHCWPYGSTSGLVRRHEAATSNLPSDVRCFSHMEEITG